MTSATPDPTVSASRVETIAHIVIMLAIGVAAGAASFTHVHAVASAHGQSGWLAWADAIVLELMSIASGLELRRRKRYHAPLRFPALVLVFATALSISAQVVEAERSIIGWIAAALPALGFLVMVKIALSRSGTTRELPAPPPEPTDGVDHLVPAHDEPRSAADPISVTTTDDRGTLPVSGVSSLAGEHQVIGRAHTTRVRRRQVPGARDASRVGAIKVPATAASVSQWAATWVRMCADSTTAHGPLNDDRYARDRYQLSAKQLRNIRNAATSGALRRKADELGLPLPADYIDTTVTGYVLVTADR